ncbi:MAG: DUF4870 domain-containing protein [Anaerolineae bacterium]
MVDQGTQQPTSSLPMGPEVTSNDKTMAALAYILPFIGSAIILLSESNKARPFQRLHGTQGLGLAVVYVIFEIVVNIVSLVISSATCGLGCILWIIGLAPLVPMIWYAYQAYQGQMFDVPVLTDFMVQQGWLKKA